jgi:hypothetical protein
MIKIQRSLDEKTMRDVVNLLEKGLYDVTEHRVNREPFPRHYHVGLTEESVVLRNREYQITIKRERWV